MNVVSISWVRNEADVIEAFVRHHCAFADRMIIVDHRSADATPAILAALKKEGLPLDLRHDEGFSHRQGEVMSDVLRELRSEAPDFVIPLDADEFLRTVSAGTVRAAIEALPQDTATLVPWQSYIPLPEDDASQQHVLRRIRHRKTLEAPQWCKVIIPRSELLRDVKILMGSHALVDGASNRNARHAESESLRLAHFPVRSSEQIAGKVFGGWLSQMAHPARARGAVFQWKAIFDELKSGKTIDPQTLKRFALEYGTSRQWQALPAEEKGSHSLGHFVPMRGQEMAQEVVLDPVPTNTVLRYPIERLSSLRILAENAEYLAGENARLNRIQE